MEGDLFYFVKGIVALTATLLLISHMSRKWASITSLGQRLRYLTLFYFAGLITFKSVDQAANHDAVTWSAIAAFGGAALLVFTSVVSIREDRR